MLVKILPAITKGIWGSAKLPLFHLFFGKERAFVLLYLVVVFLLDEFRQRDGTIVLSEAISEADSAPHEGDRLGFRLAELVLLQQALRVGSRLMVEILLAIY